MTEIESWLASTWTFVRQELPEPPATVLEIGCGLRGGLVSAMVRAGYDAIGIDPQAPDGPLYHRVEFERFEVTQKVDSVVACTSLHHVADLGDVLDKVTDCLAPDGSLVVVEWDWERFDEQTAQWCFARLTDIGAESSEHSWLRTIRDEWFASGRSWPEYWGGWAGRERLHTAEQMLSELNQRYACQSFIRSPCFFPDLAETSEADEQAAIDAGQIQAGGIRFAGHVKDATVKR